MELENQQNFLFYTNAEGKDNIQVYLDQNDETVWTTQKGMSEIFGTTIANINTHLRNIYDEGELLTEATIKESLIVQQEGARTVKRKVDLYNLDAIISVGYRVNSQSATRFRIWATGILKEYLVKGFVMDDERLKQGKTLFGKDYFDELIVRIREIRASERRFYQKITDIYMLSVDYNSSSPTTQTFFATVQNKLEFAITKMTAAEIVNSRADSSQPNMGLTSWRDKKKDGKIVKTDVSVAKNYLSETELSELNSVVTMYLDYAELQATRNKLMSMKDWVDKLNGFLQFNEYELLTSAGTISKAVAKKFAEEQFEKFRIIQDRNYISDFDRVVQGIQSTGSLPVEIYDKERFKGTFTISIKDEIEKQKKIIEVQKKKGFKN